jgi:hypothetical protein
MKACGATPSSACAIALAPGEKNLALRSARAACWLWLNGDDEDDHHGRAAVARSIPARRIMTMPATISSPKTEATYTSSEMSRKIDLPGVTGHRVSQAIYRGVVNQQRCPVVGKNRRIPADLLPKLRAYFAQLSSQQPEEV